MRSAVPGAPIRNRLLDRLPSKDRERVLAACEQVDLSFAEVLAEPGARTRNVYFPTSSFISQLVPMGGKRRVEVSLAGNEGISGIAVALGVSISPVQSVVQGGGRAWRMQATAFRQELARDSAMRSCVDRYIYVLMAQLMQTAGCNRFHVVEQRVARWLLMTADRAHSATFRITHEFLAYMLGVRRVGVTEAASALQRRKLIGYTRGVVTVLNRRGLERAACACYQSDLSTYRRIFS